jgi:hypothetical protein
MAEEQIARLNLSFIWTRTFDHFFRGPASLTYPYSFLARISSYKEKFDALRPAHSGTDAQGLSLPWPSRRANWFWKYYFNGTMPRDVSANRAWESLIPFRKAIRAAIETPWLNRKHNVTLEGFFYRHGVAAAITVRVLDCMTLPEAVQKALDCRRNKDYTVRWEGGSKGEYSLTALVNEILDRLCEAALGPAESKGISFPAEPFSVATIIDGGSDYRDREVLQSNDIHKALKTLASWNDAWPNADPPKLEDKRFRIKNRLDNHYLYGDQQGRAVWFPQLFTPSVDGKQKYALGWYHRNLLLSSLQTASLGAFVKHTADVMMTGAKISNYQSDWAWNAIEALNRLYHGENTYRTWSARAHMEQNSFVTAKEYLEKKL